MIALISDTHENEGAIKQAVFLILKRDVQFTLHLGDIISPPMLDLFSGLKMKLIFGNNDGERDGLLKKAESNGFEGPFDELEFSLDGKKCFAYHGTDEHRLYQRIWYGGYDYVFCGHTHKRRDEKVKNTRVINPGALFLCDPYTIAFLDPATDLLEFVEVPRGST